jgi:hypothetical protein
VIKVALIGPDNIDGRTGVVFDLVRTVLRQMGPGDLLIHTGGNGVASKIEYVYRAAKGNERRRLPKCEVISPEIGRYPYEEALRRNAGQILHHYAPNYLVIVDDSEEVRAVLELYERVDMYRTRTELHDADSFAKVVGRR